MNYFHAENVELSQLVKKRELLSPGNCIKIPGNDSDWPCLDDTSSLGWHMGHMPTLVGEAVWGSQIGSFDRSFWKGFEEE